MDAIALEPIRRAKKPEIADAIAEALALDLPDVSGGASVEAAFLRRIYRRLAGRDATASTAYGVVAEIGDRLGLDPDPWETSEGTESRGGSTVTARAFSRILCATIGTQRCFVLCVEAGALPRWSGDQNLSRVTFGSTSGAGLAMLDAGPGSRVALVEVNELNDDSPDAYTLVGHACVRHISSRYRVPPWTVTLSDVEALAPTPVTIGLQAGPRDALLAIEVAPSQWDHALAVAMSRQSPSSHTRTVRGADLDPTRSTTRRCQAPAGDEWPPQLPIATVIARTQAEPEYVDDTSGVVPQNPGASLVADGRHDRELDRRTERAAVELVIQYMTSKGWRLDQDVQNDGAGFDLRFTKEDEEARVEVKGIRSRSLIFNLTAKEWWRCRTDPRFVVLAVTGALTGDPYVHVVTREMILRGERAATGYRVVPTAT